MRVNCSISSDLCKPLSDTTHAKQYKTQLTGMHCMLPEIKESMDHRATPSSPLPACSLQGGSLNDAKCSAYNCANSSHPNDHHLKPNI